MVITNKYCYFAELSCLICIVKWLDYILKAIHFKENQKRMVLRKRMTDEQKE